MNINCNENINNNNHKILLYEGTYQTKHSTNRLFNFIKNMEFIIMLSKTIHHIPINIVGNNTYNEGNIFKGILFFSFPYICKVLKYKNSNLLKEIKWELTTKYIKNLIKIFHIKIKLYKVTDDNTTIIYLKIESLNYIDDKINFEKKSDYFFKDFIFKIENFLSKSNIDLIQIESGIILASMEDIWYFLVNMKELKKIAPLIPFDDLNLTELNTDKIYDFIIFKDLLVKIKIIMIDKKIGWNKWIILIKTFGEDNKISANDLLIQLLKINSKECQVYLIHSFLEPVSQDVINKFSYFKIYIIKSIKDYLENYKSNNNNEEQINANK
jgi:hypothetical protein